MLGAVTPSDSAIQELCGRSSLTEIHEDRSTWSHAIDRKASCFELSSPTFAVIPPFPAVGQFRHLSIIGGALAAWGPDVTYAQNSEPSVRSAGQWTNFSTNAIRPLGACRKGLPRTSLPRIIPEDILEAVTSSKE